MERVELNLHTNMSKMKGFIEIKELVYKGAYKIYGDTLPKEVKDRLNKELKSIIDNGYSTIYLIAQRLVKRTNDDGYIVANRGAIGSSLVAYCIGITEIDPIKYNIPFEIFAGLNGDKEPDIALCVPYNYKQQLEECVEDKYLDRITFRICESNIPVILYRLKELTGIDPTSIPLNDKETLKMICSGETSGIPEFDKELARNIILETHPTTFDDLVKISGLLHGTNAWKNNAQDLIKNGTTTLQGLIDCRDDIMIYLITKGLTREQAFKIMEIVRKGKTLKHKEKWEEYKEIMKQHNVPNWYINSCEKIAYLFPKGHVVGGVINSFRIGWYKVHYKNEFNQVIKEFDE